LEGKVSEVQRDFAAIQAEEAQVQRLAGRRPTSYATLLGRSATSFFAAVTNPVLFAVRIPADVARGVLDGLVGAWPTFDRKWARTTGPKVRDMRSAAARFAELMPDVRAGRYANGERIQVAQIVTRGSSLSSTAADLFARWISSPMSAFDMQNSNLAANAVRLFVLNAQFPAVAAALQASGVGTGAAAGGIVGAVQWVGEKVSGAAQTLTGGGTAAAALAPPEEQDQPRQPTGGNPWAVAATLLLVAATGYVGYRVVKDVVLAPKDEEE